MPTESVEERQKLTEVQNQIQRARKTSIRTPAAIAQQKETLKRLIELVQSPYSSLKTLAASNIKWFVKDFPDLEDDAINAVYDLCEDADPKVRKDGYRAITSVSREQKKWVKRNADVLVQLLQSDEPEEVEVVEHQLTEHIDMDPVATLGVLCDQIVPIEEPTDEDEQATRDRLRSLVLAFITGRAKRGIVERHANQYKGPAESILVSGCLKAVPKVPEPDINIIVKDILLSLPSYSTYSTRGNELAELLLSQAKLLLKSETLGLELSSIPKTRYFLELASFIAIDKQTSLPTYLLQFFCVELVTHAVLSKLTEDAQAFAISSFANVLMASEEHGKYEIEAPLKGLPSLRDQAIDAGVLLLSRFIDFKEPNSHSWAACKMLLRVYVRQKESTSWTTPSQLKAILAKIQENVTNYQVTQSDKSATEEIENLIRSLLQTSSKVSAILPSTVETNLAKGNTNTSNGKSSGGPVQINRKRDLPASLPPRPQSVSSRPTTPYQGSTPVAAATTIRTNWQRKSAQTSMRQQSDWQESAVGISKNANTPFDDATLSNQKRDPGSSKSQSQSLLSRLGVNASSSTPNVAANGRDLDEPSVTPAKRRAELESSATSKRQYKQRSSDTLPEGGWSIKGAASKASTQKESGGNRTGSLLTRMNSSSGRDGESGGPRRRGRTRS